MRSKMYVDEFLHGGDKSIFNTDGNTAAAQAGGRPQRRGLAVHSSTIAES